MRTIRRNIYKITFVIVLIIVISIIIIKRSLLKNEVLASTINNSVEEKEITKNITDVVEDIKPIYVDIKGEIVNPGVYEVNDNERVIDIINKAGGMTGNANTSLINLAMKITDEMVIVIYSNEEIENKMNDKDTIIYECKCPDTINDVCVSQFNNDNNTNNSFINNDNSNMTFTTDIININIASKEELMTLTGIGESKALAIIEYRNTNGNFPNPEDILNVSGIGESIYEKIKDSITT